jgi:hypothetical protein
MNNVFSFMFMFISALLISVNSYSFSDPKTYKICLSIKQNYYENTVKLELASRAGYPTARLKTAQKRYIKSYDSNYCYDHFGLITSDLAVNKDPDNLSIH